jgi:hypothetical protein
LYKNWKSWENLGHFLGKDDEKKLQHKNMQDLLFKKVFHLANTLQNA